MLSLDAVVWMKMEFRVGAGKASPARGGGVLPFSGNVPLHINVQITNP